MILEYPMVKSNDSDEKRIKKFVDDWGVIREANKILPKDDFKLNLLNVIAELEDNDCHISRNFPISQLHKVTGIKNIYTELILIRLVAGEYIYNMIKLVIL